jgi:hypothetical protein
MSGSLPVEAGRRSLFAVPDPVESRPVAFFIDDPSIPRDAVGQRFQPSYLQRGPWASETSEASG